MRALVTGGAGFIGSHVVNELLKMDMQVVVIDDLSGGFIENINPNATFIEGTILNHKFIDDVFNKYSFDYVYHLAAYAAEGLSHFIKRFNYNNNLIGSINLINSSVNHNVKCFVFTSSIAVYGALKPPMHEDLHPEPEDSYAIAKYSVELELKASKMMYDMDYVIFRPHNVYGEMQNIGDKYRNVIGIFMNQIMQGKPITIFGDGKQTRAFSYIKDISGIIAKSVDNVKAINDVFNIGADETYTISQLAKVVMDVMGNGDEEIRYLDARKEVVHAHADHSKVREVFGANTSTSLESGVRAMANWALQVGSKESQIFSSIEIEKNMPDSWKNILRKEK